MWVSEMEWMWNLVTSLILSGARIIIIERFAKSVSGSGVGAGGGCGCHSTSGDRRRSTCCSCVEWLQLRYMHLGSANSDRLTDWPTDLPAAWLTYRSTVLSTFWLPVGVHTDLPVERTTILLIYRMAYWPTDRLIELPTHIPAAWMKHYQKNAEGSSTVFFFFFFLENP
jgi:hypothetical protein